MTENIINTSLGNVRLIKQIGKGKSGYSFLAELNGNRVVFKEMHDEPCSYYKFSENKLKLEVDAYRILEEIGIPIPGLLTYNIDEQYLIKTYVDGICGHNWVAENIIDENIIKQLFVIADILRANNLNIDYFPPNFVISEDKLFYIDYEINPYCEEWNLENWGIYYWANNSGMAEFFRSGDWRMINENVNSGVPIKRPFEEKVTNWKLKFGNHNC